MSEAKTRKVYSAAFKAKVGLEALREGKTVNQIAQAHGVHPAQVSQWKKEIQDQAASLFEGKRGQKRVAEHSDQDRLFGEIGRLKMELDWLKKVRNEPVDMRLDWVDCTKPLPLVRQCELAGVCRSTVYASQTQEAQEETKGLGGKWEEGLALLRLLDEEYTRHPFYGTRRMVLFLPGKGYVINRKRVQRLMRQLGLRGMAPVPDTSRPHPDHKIYPYLLRDVKVERPNQIWSTDITYIRMAHGFMYLIAVMDWYSRKVLAWRVSNTLSWC